MASVGVVAVATSLALRLNAMSGWIMWAMTDFFRELGVVKEGMLTIAQPVTLVDQPDATPLDIKSGADRGARSVAITMARKPAGLDHVNLSIAAG